MTHPNQLEYLRRSADNEPLNLQDCDLSNASLENTNFRLAMLSHSTLDNADLSGADLEGANLQNASLRGTVLKEARLRGCNLKGTAMSAALLQSADLSGTDLRGADLRGAHLQNANLTNARLEAADLRGTHLDAALLVDCNLGGARLERATFASTVISCDLSTALGLESTIHEGPSDLTLRALELLKAAGAEQFLRACGVTEEQIKQRAPLSDSLHFSSCFISYASSEEALAQRLHNDLQAADIRCWLWNYDARIGASISNEIDEALRLHEKLIVILSKASLSQPYILREISAALDREDSLPEGEEHSAKVRRGAVLIPIRIDDYIFEAWDHPLKQMLMDRVIADASGWEMDPVIYQRLKERLVRDLKQYSEA